MDVRRVSSNVKSIQRGVITIASSATSQAATIAAVNTAKSELRFLGFNSGEVAFSTSGPQTIFPMLVLTNATTITATRVNFNAGICSVSYEITEFN